MKIKSLPISIQYNIKIFISDCEDSSMNIISKDHII